MSALTPTLQPPPSIGPTSPILAEQLMSPADGQPIGIVLLLLTVFFVSCNTFLVFIVLRDWYKIRNSRQFDSNVLCLLLTITDLVLAVIVGLPVGLHLTWVEHFQTQSGAVFYTRYLEFFLFEYLFLLRIIIIAITALDKCLHVTRPLTHWISMTRNNTMMLVTLTVALPFITRVVPNAFYLVDNSGSMVCSEFRSPSDANIADNYIIPLTCSAVTGPMEVKIELAVIICVTLSSLLLILVSNACIMVTLLRSYTRALSRPRQEREQFFRRIDKGLIRTGTLTVAVCLVFFTSNIPYVGIWFADYLYRNTDAEEYKMSDKLRLCLTLMSFLSIPLHPWLFLLQMRSIRDLFNKATSISSARSTNVTSLKTSHKRQSDPIAVRPVGLMKEQTPVRFMKEQTPVGSVLGNGKSTGLAYHGSSIVICNFSTNTSL